MAILFAIINQFGYYFLLFEVQGVDVLRFCKQLLGEWVLEFKSVFDFS